MDAPLTLKSTDPVLIRFRAPVAVQKLQHENSSVMSGWLFRR
jgi:hypothetical protein